MAAPRSIQFIALRNLSRHGHQQTRRLSMTGHEYASRVFAKEPSTRAAVKAVEENNTSSTPQTRTFNTSRTLKSPNDTSTIDFTFLPSQTYTSPSDIPIRMPILPSTYHSATASRSTAHPEIEDLVMKPTISSMSADTLYHPMSELSDGHAMNVDFHALAESFAAGLQRIKVPVEERAGIVKQMWSDMVDDVLGGGAKKAVSA